MRPIDAQELKGRLTTSDICNLMEYFGAYPLKQTTEYIVFPTICHCSGSPKLYFYPSTNSWYCWSQCGGNIDILSIIQDQEGLSLPEAIEWAENFFQLNKHQWGRPKIQYTPKEIVKPEIDVTEKLKTYNSSILNTFIDYQPIEWLQEGISEEVMKMFGIKFDINTNSIIIPHKDIDGRLVGIRCRNLLKDIIEKYGKYLPYTDIFSNITYKHKLSMNLYGLYENKKNILERKKCIIFESEKSTMLMNSYYPNDSIAVSVGGSVVSDYQIALLKHLGIEEVIIAFDYEIREKLLKKFEKTYKKCALQFNVYILDNLLMKELLDESDSPIDKGKEKFEKLLWNKRKYELEVKI